jgi:hypothetical protein
MDLSVALPHESAYLSYSEIIAILGRKVKKYSDDTEIKGETVPTGESGGAVGNDLEEADNVHMADDDKLEAFQWGMESEYGNMLAGQETGEDLGDNEEANDLSLFEAFRIYPFSVAKQKIEQALAKQKHTVKSFIPVQGI